MNAKWKERQTTERWKDEKRPTFQHLQSLTDPCWHVGPVRLRTTNTRLHVSIWATPTEKTNSLIHRPSENKLNLSLWELMQSDENGVLMWAFVFSSGPLPSEGQCEYCIRPWVCVSKVSECLSACEHNRMRTQMDERQTEGGERQIKEREWWEGWDICWAEGWESSQSRYQQDRALNILMWGKCWS